MAIPIFCVTELTPPPKTLRRWRYRCDPPYHNISNGLSRYFIPTWLHCGFRCRSRTALGLILNHTPLVVAPQASVQSDACTFAVCCLSSHQAARVVANHAEVSTDRGRPRCADARISEDTAAGSTYRDMPATLGCRVVRFSQRCSCMDVVSSYYCSTTYSVGSTARRCSLSVQRGLQRRSRTQKLLRASQRADRFIHRRKEAITSPEVWQTCTYL